MVKHTIILNPIDSLIQINGSDTTRKSIFSSPEYCREALNSMELVSGAKEILSFLRNNSKNFKTIIVTSYDEAIVRLIASHFNIPYVAVYRGRVNKSSLYVRAIGKIGSDVNDAVVVSGNAIDIKDAETSGIEGLRYGVSRSQNGVEYLDDLLYHLGLRLHNKPS